MSYPKFHYNIGGRSSIDFSVLFLIAAFFSGGLFSCADDESSFSKGTVSGNPEAVSFTVTTSDHWNAGSTTRAAVATRQATSLSTLTLTTQERASLYLLPEVKEGISLDPSISNSTRSSLTNEENISDFGVFASLHPDSSSAPSDSFSPDYMTNVEVTKDRDWKPAAEYLWPGKASLHINAYSPYFDPATPGSDGIISLPTAADTGQLKLSWTTPADVSDQFDLLWATPVDASESPCDLTFNHALSAIKFVAGPQLTPCTVKSISVSGIITSGVLNLETGDWTLGKETASFEILPGKSLKATDGSSFVAPSTPLADDASTFLLLPQSLSDDAEISLVIEIDGTEHSYNAPLAGQVWTAGKTTIYRLSASADSDTLILDILDTEGNPVSILESSYTGGALNYKVSSHLSSTTGGAASSTQIPWKAEFVDDDGNVIDAPQWISSFVSDGEGDEDCISQTVIQAPVFTTISAETKALRAASDINATSGQTPYNLANSSGAPTVENTANTYIVSSPGEYSIPLVYGNAIKNGTDNKEAYIWDTHTRNVLKDFINHLGHAITDPYIYNNADCVPSDAVIVWEGRIGTISNVGLSPDSHYLYFTVNKDLIRQGNAVIAVRDKDKNIMWSWQIWLTPHHLDDDALPFTYNNATYHIMARNIGQTTGGDVADFQAKSVKVRFTQITDGTIEPKSVTITINRDAYQEKTSFHYSYYQWGRKDPFNSGFNIWYAGDHSILKATPVSSYISRPTDREFVATTILTPETFWTADHGSQEPSYEYVNLWNTQTTDRNGIKSFKTIYDPSPVGYKVPGLQMAAFLAGSTSGYEVEVVNKFVDYSSVQFTLPDGYLDFTLLGYLSSNDAKESNSESYGPIWLNSANLKEAMEIPFDKTLDMKNTLISRTMGYGVRPIKDE